MLDPVLVNQIEDLLAAGTTYQEIRRRCHVSNGAIADIAHGRWCRSARAPEPGPRTGRVDRCPTCGRLIRLPCLACEVRPVDDGDELPAGEDGRIELDLEPSEQARYEALCAGHLHSRKRREA